MNQKEEDIYKFKKGDIITRILPVIDLETGKKDYAFVGIKLIFMGIANAAIYLEQELDHFAKVLLGMDKNVFQLPIDLWLNGWAYHIEPDFLDDDSILIDDESKIQDQIDLAIKGDFFEKAAELRIILEEMRKKGGDNGPN